MENFGYKQILENAPFAFALVEVRLNAADKIVGLVFRKVNKAFEQMTRLSGKNLIGQTIDIIQSAGAFHYFQGFALKMEKLNKVGEKTTLEDYYSPTKKWIKGQIVKESTNTFSILFNDITPEKSLVQTSELYLREENTGRKYQQITNQLLGITNARYVVMNVLNENSKDFTTVALAGKISHIRKAMSLIGMEVQNHVWKYDPKREKLLKGQTIVRYESLSKLSLGVLPGYLIKTLEKTFNTGQVVLLKITDGEKTYGDFTLIMQKGENLEYDTILEMFSKQVALILEKEKTENLLNDFFFINPVLLSVFDQKGKFIRANEAWEKFTAHTFRDLKERSFFDFIHPDDLHSTIESMKPLQDKNNIIVNVENRYRGSEGNFRHIEWLLQRKGDYVYSVGRDFTEHKVSEEELRNSKLQFSLAVEGTNDGIWDWDIQNDHVYLSPRWKEMIGYADDELENSFHTFTELLHPDDKPVVLKKMEEYLKGNITNYETEFRFKRKDGSYAWILGKAKALRDKKGKPYRMAGSNSDITLRKEMEHMLLEREKQLDSILHAQKQMISRFKEDTTLTYVNKAYKDYFGQGEKSITGKKWVEFVPEEQRPGILRRLKNLKNDPSILSDYKHEIFDKEGRKRWIEWTDYIIRDQDGKFMEFQSVGTDITDRIDKLKLEKEIEISRNTIKFKQNFLASMSHEMKTPLIGITSISELLENTSSDSQKTELLTILKQSAENLKEIIDQVLDYSHIESGKVQLDLQPHQTFQIINYSKNFFKGICNKDLTFIPVYDDSLPEKLLFDRKRVHQVVNNLIINAVKFTEQGHVSLRMENMPSPSLNKNEFLIKIQVEDTGIGISEERQKNIFSPFSQVHEINTDRYQGIGIGLSLCKEIAELHGGEAGLNSIPGKGTKVWFTFKSIYEPDQCSDQKSEYLSDDFKTKSLKILFVEDKRTTQKVVKLMLNSMGHKVHLADNGYEAVNNYSATDYDLIFMDIQMPVMDGITACQTIKEKFSNPPPVIGLSANSFEGAHEKYMEMGMDEYITKPVSKDDLQKIIRQFTLKNLLGQPDY